MKFVIHKDFAGGRWWEMSHYEQMGNAGSELNRAIRWKNKNPEIAPGAINRALELMALTLADPRHKKSFPRLREIARPREVLVDFLLGSNEYNSTAESLQRYFDAFAIAASIDRERSRKK